MVYAGRRCDGDRMLAEPSFDRGVLRLHDPSA
jgi:hypothetical protein